MELPKVFAKKLQNLAANTCNNSAMSGKHWIEYPQHRCDVAGNYTIAGGICGKAGGNRVNTSGMDGITEGIRGKAAASCSQYLQQLVDVGEQFRKYPQHRGDVMKQCIEYPEHRGDAGKHCCDVGVIFFPKAVRRHFIQCSLDQTARWSGSWHHSGSTFKLLGGYADPHQIDRQRLERKRLVGAGEGGGAVG